MHLQFFARGTGTLLWGESRARGESCDEGGLSERTGRLFERKESAVIRDDASLFWKIENLYKSLYDLDLNFVTKTVAKTIMIMVADKGVDLCEKVVKLIYPSPREEGAKLKYYCNVETVICFDGNFLIDLYNDIANFNFK